MTAAERKQKREQKKEADDQLRLRAEMVGFSSLSLAFHQLCTSDVGTVLNLRRSFMLGELQLTC